MITRTNARVRALVLAVGSLASAALGDAGNGSMPIAGITLYRSGVGYFERRALVENDQRIQLRFATEQINDILKSMVILDLDGGMIEAVGYGSKEPLERRLASFGVDISDGPSLPQLLDRLRGAPLRVTTVDGPAQGTVLGVEDRDVPSGDKGTVKASFVNLLTSAGIRQFDVGKLSGVEILDPELAEELNKALEALAEHRAERVKAVDIALRGTGARQIVVAYVHEMPVWKTSYRLVLPESSEGKNAGQPTIQGWAIVENTTEEDWENVRLSLVAGRPVSFQMDLYEPLHVERPEVPVPLVAGVRPKVFEAGEEMLSMAPGAPIARGEIDRRALKEMDGAVGKNSLGLTANKGVPLDADDMTRYAAAAQASAGEVGEVFQYSLKSPVSVGRQQSAMLPILASNIDGRRVSIFNREDHPDHPMRGVELTNSTGLQLMPGPISVFDGAAYAGDAQIGHVSAGDKRLLAYAVDLDVAGSCHDDQAQQVQKIRIVDGFLEQQSLLRSQAVYTFTNKDSARERILLVEHPRYEGWDLIEPKNKAETTNSGYRFETSLAPGGKGELKVVQQYTQMERYALVDFDVNQLLAYSQSGKASAKVVEAVREAAHRQGEINNTTRQVEALDAERQGIDQDQARIRQNMGSVSKDTDLYRRYMDKLSTQETRLEQIKTAREGLLATRQKLEEELRTYLRGLNVE